MSSGCPAPITVVAVSRRGAELARRVAAGLARAQPIVPARFAVSGDVPHQGTGPAVAAAFADGTPLVLVMAAGIAVRLIAPLIQDKHRDPAVVVVDDGGRFAISLLSGHLGGANALAERVAALIGATAVITTASEAAGLPALDLLGRRRGWRLDPRSDPTAVTAALVNGEPVGLLQECGSRDWLPHSPPANLLEFCTFDALMAASLAGAVVVSDRASLPISAASPVVIHRPPTLAIGAGASRGAPTEELVALAEAALDEGGLSALSVACVASIDAKRDEPGIVALARQLGVPLRTFNAEDLACVPGDWQRSQVIARAVGVGGVCEPAALLASGGALAVRKRRSAHATIAIARRAEGVPGG